MGSWIAFIGSVVIGSLLLLSFLSFGNDMTKDSYLHTLEHVTYGNLVEATQVIERELSAIGLGINDPNVNAIANADSTDITFYLDWNGDAIVDTFRYFLSTVDSASFTDHPNDRVLYRKFNSNPDRIVAVGLTDFKITYYDNLGSETTDLTAIRVLEFELAVESTINYDNTYPRIVWHGKIAPLNLYGK
ncbi:MAG: hypothetical protein ACE5I1_08205 [bacterium]